MNRERVLMVVLVLVGVLFSAAVVPTLMYLWRPEGDMAPAAEVMLGSVYATLGIFLLIAVRNPSAHRTLIAFTAWSSFAHAGVMAVQAFHNLIPRIDLLRAVPPLAIIGLLFIALAPRKLSAERPSAASA
jgi:hypothetical protein